jgi:hypothetical protein
LVQANLKKYIKIDGKWRFVPVLKQNGVPFPGTVLIDERQLDRRPELSISSATRMGAAFSAPSAARHAKQRMPGTAAYSSDLDWVERL